MASSVVSSGALVVLEELNSSSPQFQNGASIRVTGKLLDYTVETAVAVIVDGNATLKIDTKHLKINYRVGSIYQFIGELFFESENQPILKARVGRNVDGMDLNLYRQSLRLLKEFQAEQTYN
ncbi:CST complex subunit TEN1-like [Chenopodium quinoa]|uniref:CST complex subunit TEN1 n=1 Tax=Chenopodium quinoa TaxID=63459 RepID=A0A803LS72_CHEQI|nr:CST complex subunit TEN1-like [Chenopodium quinoa]